MAPYPTSENFRTSRGTDLRSIRKCLRCMYATQVIIINGQQDRVWVSGVAEIKARKTGKRAGWTFINIYKTSLHTNYIVYIYIQRVFLGKRATFSDLGVALIRKYFVHMTPKPDSVSLESNFAQTADSLMKIMCAPSPSDEQKWPFGRDVISRLWRAHGFLPQDITHSSRKKCAGLFC